MVGSSQTEILKALVYKPEGINIEALSRSLDISRNATYQHIKTLERDGLIAGHRIEKTKGRPGQTYQLTRKGQATFQRSYSMIASLLVGAVKDRLGSGETADLFSDLGKKIGLDLGDQLSTKPLGEKIESISAVMVSLGYEAHLERDNSTNPDLPTIAAHNCVFHDVAEEHEEVCELDVALLETLSDCDVKQCECIVRGGSVCRFSFHPRV